MTRIKRFTPTQRLFHVLLMLFFLIQSATGLARMYVETTWGYWLSTIFGGYEGALTIHRLVGLLMLIAFLGHLLYILTTIDWRRFPTNLIGPDSLLPGFNDIRQARQHIGWMFGLRKPPKFERWNYLEKFDYWAVFWGVCILGGSGLILYSPTFTSIYISGWLLNIMLWVHRIEAILAMGHVFIIHFFISHLRRVSFPMDLAMFEGNVDLDRTRHERSAWVERLEQTGELKHRLARGIHQPRRLLFYFIGYVAVVIGVFLLVGSLINVPSLTWYGKFN